VAVAAVRDRPEEFDRPNDHRKQPCRVRPLAARRDDLHKEGRMAEQVRKPPTRLAATATPIPARETLDVEVHLLPTGVILVEVRGSIDAVTTPELQRRLGEATRTGQQAPPRLLLELSGVTFLDLTGLDALLHLQDRLGAASGTVELLAPSPSVVRLLHEAELDGESWMTSAHDSPDDHQAG